jgi:hypothetical protein
MGNALRWCYEMPRLNKFPIVAVLGFLTVTVQVRVYGYRMLLCTVRYPYRLLSLAFVVLDSVLDGVNQYVPVFDTG